MSEKWEDGNYVLYPAINHEQSLTDELLKSRQSPETLLARIAELEKDNAEFRQLIRDWSIVLDQNNGFQLWHVESVRQAMLEINKECEK